MKKIFGFTLAEVLITLGIIGVVAALTLPTLINRIQNKVLENQTKHFYALFTQALKRYMADQGTDSLSHTPLHYSYDEENYEQDERNYENAVKETDKFVRSYLKVAHICSTSENIHDCYSEKVSNIAGRTYDYEIAAGENIYVLMDGYTISMAPPSTSTPGVLQVDVNGKKRPNVGGRDIWYLSIFHDGSIDEGGVTPECRKGNGRYCRPVNEIIEDRFQSCIDNNGWNSYGFGCFGHFKANNFKFDY